eukprot:m.60445 g.60445  ORF g.60445 m.60445 type:complete len:646 (+) comp13850_c0_seq22:1564-3501(+)
MCCSMVRCACSVALLLYTVCVTHASRRPWSLQSGVIQRRADVLCSAFIEDGSHYIFVTHDKQHVQLKVPSAVINDAQDIQYSFSGTHIALYDNRTNGFTTISDVLDPTAQPPWISRLVDLLADSIFRTMLTSDPGVVFLTANAMNSTSCSLWLISWSAYPDPSNELHIKTTIQCDPGQLATYPKLAVAYQDIVVVAVNMDEATQLSLYNLSSQNHKAVVLTNLHATGLTLFPNGVGIQGSHHKLPFALALLPFAFGSTPWRDTTMVVPMLYKDEVPGLVGFCSDFATSVVMEVHQGSSRSLIRIIRGVGWQQSNAKEYHDVPAIGQGTVGLGCNTSTVVADSVSYTQPGQVRMTTTALDYNISTHNGDMSSIVWLKYAPSDASRKTTTLSSVAKGESTHSTFGLFQLGLVLAAGLLGVCLVWTCHRWRKQRARTNRVVLGLIDEDDPSLHWSKDYADYALLQEKPKQGGDGHGHELLLAIQEGAVEETQALLKSIDNVQEIESQLHLMATACRWDRSQCLEVVLTQLAKGSSSLEFQLDDSGFNAAHWACMVGSSRCGMALLESMPTLFTIPSAKGDTCFHICLREGNMDVLQRLVLAGHVHRNIALQAFALDSEELTPLALAESLDCTLGVSLMKWLHETIRQT